MLRLVNQCFQRRCYCSEEHSGGTSFSKTKHALVQDDVARTVAAIFSGESAHDLVCNTSELQNT